MSRHRHLPALLLTVALAAAGGGAAEAANYIVASEFAGSLQDAVDAAGEKGMVIVDQPYVLTAPLVLPRFFRLMGMGPQGQGVIAYDNDFGAAITFAGPAGLPCNTSLTVTNADTQSASSPFNVSPVITSVLGIGGYPAAGGTQLLIVGQNFVPGTSVTIGGNPMTINSTSASLINGILPPGAVGPAAVVVTTPFSCAVTGSLTYTP